MLVSAEEASLAQAVLLLVADVQLLLLDDWLQLVVVVVAAVQLSSVAELVVAVDADYSADAVEVAD